jgi:deoxyribonuclease-4
MGAIWGRYNFGLKLWSTNIHLVEPALLLINAGLFKYIELSVIPKTDVSSFDVNVPYILHVSTENYGTNIGQKSMANKTLQNIEQSIQWADRLNAEYIIVHAGYDCMEDAINMLHDLKDDRILIENMPCTGLNNESMIGYSPEQIQSLISINNHGFCLDVGHALKAGGKLNLNPYIYIDKFINMPPSMFHICDGIIENERDEHLNINNGKYDFNVLFNKIPLNSKITLETPKSSDNSLCGDINNLLKLNELNYLQRKN